MDILFLLIPVSFILIIVAIKIFFWAVKDGQFDDLDGAAHSILFDKDEKLHKPAINNQEPTEAQNKAKIGIEAEKVNNSE